MKKWFLIVLFLVLFSSFAFAIDSFGDEEVKVYVFHGKGCSHCARLFDFLERQVELHPNIEVIDYEVYFNSDNRDLMERFASTYGVEIEGVPMSFIGNKVIGGADLESFADELLLCSVEGCVDAADKVSNCECEKCGNDICGKDGRCKCEDGFKKTVTVGAVVSAAIVDAINPCAFAVLIILLSTILVSKNRRKALYAGIAFACAVFISYFLMGIGLYSAISTIGISNWFYIVVAFLAIVLGLFNLKDYLWYGKWFKMEVPDSWRPRMKMLIKSVTSVPGAFLIGFIISLFLLPCTSGPYIVILGLLSKVATRNYAMLMLVLYNLVFILPMLLITFLVYFGITTTEKAERWRQRELKVLHLIAGLIILLLGIGMIIALLLGWL